MESVIWSPEPESRQYEASSPIVRCIVWAPPPEGYFQYVVYADIIGMLAAMRERVTIAAAKSKYNFIIRVLRTSTQQARGDRRHKKRMNEMQRLSCLPLFTTCWVNECSPQNAKRPSVHTSYIDVNVAACAGLLGSGHDYPPPGCM